MTPSGVIFLCVKCQGDKVAVVALRADMHAAHEMRLLCSG